MKILILGAGKMGTFLTDCLCTKHDVALYDTNANRLRFVFNTRRFTRIEEIRDFEPELCINAVTLKYTIEAFDTVLPYLPATCILSDIASVKTGLQAYYTNIGHRYVSTHPMFGPTFANLDNLSTQNAIIIAESDPEGKDFFRELYASLQLRIFEYTFDEHDETIAYSLSIPFVSSLVFAAVMKHQDAPGTTFKKHLAVAHGLLSEDDYLLSEILFNPHTAAQIDGIQAQMHTLRDIVARKDTAQMQQFLAQVRKNIE
ncbi:MAG: prephenate dehydrogenase [Paludibacteraceae bacterium]